MCLFSIALFTDQSHKVFRKSNINKKIKTLAIIEYEDNIQYYTVDQKRG